MQLAAPTVSFAPIVSSIEAYPLLGVLLPMLAEEPKSSAPEEEVGRGEQTVQVGEGTSHLAAEEECLEEGAQEMSSRDLDTRASTAGPSSSMGPE